MATGATLNHYRQWVDRPENRGTRWELLRGGLVELASWPNSFRAIHLQIVQLLGDYIISRGSGSVAFLGDGLITATDPDTVRCPAVMVFLDSAAEDFPVRFAQEVPAVVIELSPPGDAWGQQLRRIADYFQFGVPLVWLVVPDERCVIRYTPNEFPKVLDDTDELTGNGVLPDFSCRVTDFFSLPGQANSAPAPPAT